MLLGAGKRPVASGMEPAASQATNGLIIELRRAAAELWEARAEAIKASCAPHVPTGRVDEMDVLAWLTADALGHPLLHADDTNPVGKRVAAHATRAERKLRDVDADARKAVAKARAAASKKPALLPTIAAAAANGESARSAHLEKAYDPQLPAPTVGAKRPELERCETRLDQVRVKARKVLAHSKVCSSEFTRAGVRTDRALDALEKVWATDTLSGRVLQLAAEACQAANAAEVAAKAELLEAATVVRQAYDDEQAAMDALREVADPPSEDDDEQAAGVDFFDVYTELQHMTCAVAMAAAGCAHCAHCAHLMVRHAADLASDQQISRGVDPPRRSDENEDEWRRYLSAWTRAQVLTDTLITAPAWVAAEAAAPRCTECATCCAMCRAAGTLTAAGEAATDEVAAAAREADVIATAMLRSERKRGLATAS
ncbi:MAG: hypothetical protein ACKVKF_26730 [Rhodobacterales bacterium]